MSQVRSALEIGDTLPESVDLALIALGGNMPSEMGAPLRALSAAIGRFRSYGLHLKALSAFYETPCFPAGSGPDYVNAAAVVKTELSAQGVLNALHEIEGLFGRERKQRWGQRTLDLDLIAVGNLVLPNDIHQLEWRNLPPQEQIESTPDQLILPHPRLQDRGFVLKPLADVANDWVHPGLEKNVGQMLASISEASREEVKRL